MGDFSHEGCHASCANPFRCFCYLTRAYNYHRNRAARRSRQSKGPAFSRSRINRELLAMQRRLRTWARWSKKFAKKFLMNAASPEFLRFRLRPKACIRVGGTAWPSVSRGSVRSCFAKLAVAISCQLSARNGSLIERGSISTLTSEILVASFELRGQFRRQFRL